MKAARICAGIALATLTAAAVFVYGAMELAKGFSPDLDFDTHVDEAMELWNQS